MGKINIKVGDRFEFAKTIAECDVYMYVGMTGDMSPNHINEEFCKNTQFKTRIVPGCLTFAFSSTAAAFASRATGQVCVSKGYDNVRFLKPVFFGDTITSVYTVEEVDEEKMVFKAKCELFNQNKELVLFAIHLHKVLE